MAKEKAKKFKLRIDSDGTVAGTRLTVNGEEVTKTKNVTNTSLYVSGGVKWDKDDKLTPHISFDYRVLNKNDDGSETGENYSYSPEGTVERGSIGKPVEKVNDAFVGSGENIIDTILEYKEKTSRYIPDRDQLVERTHDSLQDLLSDLERESE